LVSKKIYSIDDLKNKRIGIPGLNTSAFRIFKLFYGNNFDFIEMRFDMIIPSILSGVLDAGIIIHEGRFTYKNFALNKIIDLGNKWESKYNAPIPLGAILIHKTRIDAANKINLLINKSISYAEDNFDNLKSFIKKYAQELSDDVIEKHINLFVNEYSRDLSDYIELLSNFLELDTSCFV
jgi:1,4-dihydroxy-6-naphthoate synthase